MRGHDGSGNLIRLVKHVSFEAGSIWFAIKLGGIREAPVLFSLEMILLDLLCGRYR